MDFSNISFEKNDKYFRLFNFLILICSLGLYFSSSLFFNSLNNFFSFYFSDLLASIVLFSFLNLVYPIKIKNIFILFIITIFAAFVWEYVALFIKPGSVFDIIDVVCYFISSLIYISLIHFYKYKLESWFKEEFNG